jgi:hypothetical protein
LLDDELTWEVGRVMAVDVDDGDNAVDVRPSGAGEVAAEVEAQKLVLRGVEPKPRRGGKQITTEVCSSTTPPKLNQKPMSKPISKTRYTYV